MFTRITLDDLAFRAWHHALDNLLFEAEQPSLFDVELTNLELRALFDDGLSPDQALELLAVPHLWPDADLLLGDCELAPELDLVEALELEP